MVDDRTALMSARALSQGYEILWYTIDRVLGQGGFGITYLAHDRNLDRSVAIKEYLPTSFAYRREDYSVKPITGDHRESFAWGLNSFQKEAQTLARFSHPNIVRVNSVFEANNTAYMVMEYEHGQSLAALYKNTEKQRDQSLIEQIFFPIFDGLKEIHKFGFIHRDIKPANIYIRDDETPVLIDFGSARQTSQQQDSEMTSLVSQGYTPLEQYSTSYGAQGPWTDIYALAATIFEGIVGGRPAESLSRSACLLRAKPDLVVPLSTQDYPAFSQQFLDAVFIGLKLEPEARPKSIENWSLQFDSSGATTLKSSKDSSFAALDSDRTRTQPPHKPGQFDQNAKAHVDSQNQFDEYELNPSDEVTRYSGNIHTGNIPAERNGRSPSAAAARVDNHGRRDQMRDQSDHPPFDDALNFDDDDSFGANANAVRLSGNTSTRTRQSKPKGRGLILGSVTVLALLSAIAGYMFYTSYTTNTELPIPKLGSMPRPPQPITTILPKDNVLEQLGYMSNLAPLLAQAYSINSANPDLLESIQQTEQSLLSLAKTWNASRYTDVASQIIAVSKAMPAAVHDQGRVQEILATSAQALAYDQIIAYLNDKHYLRPSGNSVLDKISTVNINEYQKLKTTSQWQQMMAELYQSAMNKLANSEFNHVAKLTEAALSLDADHAGFNSIKLFLAGS